jgi:phosphatidylglycerophosphate synthase
MAPNTVTFIGFIAMISSYLVMLFYDRTLQEEIPRWIFIKSGIDILLYQTFDAMDGK